MDTRGMAAEDRHGRRARHRKVMIERAALVAVLTAVVLATLAISASAKSVSADIPTRTVVVEAGQTLWGLANAHPLPGRRTSETVEAIEDLNGLEGPAVAVGQVLRVPDVR